MFDAMVLNARQHVDCLLLSGPLILCAHLDVFVYESRKGQVLHAWLLLLYLGRSLLEL
jgi:hypothetical protein